MTDHVGAALPPARPTPALKSPWVIGWLVLLGTVLAVNLVMVTLAFVTSPGLVVKDAYERGQDYEKSVQTRLRDAPDWTMQIDTSADLLVGEPGQLRLFVVDRAGQPVRADRVTLQAYRPSDAQRDFTAELTEEVPGRYVAEVSFPLPGIWDARMVVQAGGKEHAVERRLHVLRP